MEYLPIRKSPRAEFYDYCDGDFFITICTREKEHSFGEIRNNKMIYSKVGKYCDEQFYELSQHYPYAQVLVHQVMPNHLHAIIRIGSDLVGTHGSCVRPRGDNNSQLKTADARAVRPYELPQLRALLGIVIGGLKRAVTIYARRNGELFGWQSRYHDHRIRGHSDGNMIWEYIENNVSKWQEDCFNQWDK